ncbi:MAG: RNA polymerase sigma factor, partial [Candidatus Binataceae bacterium]
MGTALNRGVHQVGAKSCGRPRPGGEEIWTRGMHSDEFRSIAVGLLSSLYNAAFRLTRDADAAEDLVQDTYTSALAHPDDLRSLAAAKAWLMRILYHRFISLRRRERSELKVLEGGLEERPASEVALSLERATIARLSRPAIRAALDKLPDEMRGALLMCVVEGMSYQEIAKIMDCPVGTVRSRIARARGQMTHMLAAEAAVLGIGRGCNP